MYGVVCLYSKTHDSCYAGFVTPKNSDSITACIKMHTAGDGFLFASVVCYVYVCDVLSDEQ